MSEAYSIQADYKTVGIVVRTRRGFRFHASDRDYAALEAGFFRRPSDAERSARALSRTLQAARTPTSAPVPRLAEDSTKAASILEPRA